jgi:hypothetical protein
VRAGYDTFVSEVHSAIADNLFALFAADQIDNEDEKQAALKAIIDRIKTRVETAVRSAIQNDLNRKFRLSLDQVRALGKAMNEAAADGENPTALAAIRLLLLSGFDAVKRWAFDRAGSCRLAAQLPR